jgi:hypothetical protein
MAYEHWEGILHSAALFVHVPWGYKYLILRSTQFILMNYEYQEVSYPTDNFLED